MQHQDVRDNSPAYTSNVKPGEKADIVIVIGVEEGDDNYLQRHYQDVVKNCEKNGLKYAILGDGKTPLNDADIKRLPPTDNVVALLHGNVKSDGPNEKYHTVDFYGHDEAGQKKSTDLIQELQNQTGATNILFESCHSGRINQDIKENHAKGNQTLLANSEIITTADQNEVAITGNVAVLESNFIQAIGDNKKAGTEFSMSAYYSEMLSKTPDTLIYGTQQDNNFKHFANGRNNMEHVALNQNSIETCVNAAQNDYNKFLEGAGKAPVKPTEMSVSDVDHYREQAAVNYALHNDHKSFQQLLDSNPEHADALRRTGLTNLVATYDRTSNGDIYGVRLLDLLVRDGGADMLGDIVNKSKLSEDDRKSLASDLAIVRADKSNDGALNQKLDAIIHELHIKPYKDLLEDINGAMKAADATGVTDPFGYLLKAEKLEQAKQHMEKLSEMRANDSNNPVIFKEAAALREKIQQITENNNKAADNICKKEIPNAINNAEYYIANANAVFQQGDSEKSTLLLNHAKALLEKAKQDMTMMQEAGAMDDNTKQQLDEKVEQQLNNINEVKAYQAQLPEDAELPDEPEGDVPLAELPDEPEGDVPLAELPDMPEGDAPDAELPDEPVGDAPYAELPDEPVGDAPEAELTDEPEDNAIQQPDSALTRAAQEPESKRDNYQVNKGVEIADVLISAKEELRKVSILMSNKDGNNDLIDRSLAKARAQMTFANDSINNHSKNSSESGLPEHISIIAGMVQNKISDVERKVQERKDNQAMQKVQEAEPVRSGPGMRR